MIEISSINDAKIKKIQEILSDKKIIVAFSGGVDSTLITYLAKKFCKDVIAVTVKNEFISKEEFNEAKNIAKEMGIDWTSIDVSVLSDPSINNNPPDRCYLCKKKIMMTLENIRKAERFDIIIDGTNVNDVKEYRPGLLALEELGIKSPLKEVGITKEEVREISKKFNLKTWNKPSMTCMATRFPYFDSLTPKKIKMIRSAEKFIREQYEIKILRVRFQFNEARIEVGLDELEKILKRTFLEKIRDHLKELGFEKVLINLDGYQSGIYDKEQLEKNY